MNRMIRTGMTGALLIGALAGLTALGTVAPSAGDVTVDPAPFVDRSPWGTVELLTDPTGQLKIRVTEVGGSPSTVDVSPGRQDKCRVDLGALGQHLGLEVVNASVTGGVLSTTPMTPRRDVGLVDNGLGSREQNNCNRSNGRLEPGHAFVITLGTDPKFDDVVFDYGVLDIEAKFGADLLAETSLLAGSQIRYEDTLSNASDNDADAQGADNNRVSIGAAASAGATMGPAGDDFDRLVIVPTSADNRGQVALEGGGDFAAAGTSEQNRTVFHLVTSKTYEHTVVCYADGGVFDPNGDGTVKGIIETPADPDWTVVVDPDGGADYPSQTRLFRYVGKDAAGDPKPCPAIGADLSGDPGGVLLEPSDDTAFLRVELTWIVPAALVDLTDGDPFARTVDVDGDGPLLPTSAEVCDGFAGAGAFDPAAPGDVTHPADAPWCVLSDTRVLTQVDPDGEGELGPVDVVVQTQIWDGLGDPRWN
jgi:hypothetical protein